MVQANLPTSAHELDNDFEADERLFHYTSSLGLYGILESDCLWATHFKYLNDSNEFFAARKSLTEFVELELRRKLAVLKVSGEIDVGADESIKDLSVREAENIINSLYTATLNSADPFVFSSYVSRPAGKDFRNGELLHWATYGRDGGYALEINPHKLAALLGPGDNILSQKAVYVGDGVPTVLKDDYAIIGKAAQAMIVGIVRGIEDVDIGSSGKAFMRVASIIKDQFFENEKEARVMAMRLKKPFEGYTAPKVFIRHHHSRPIPYIKLFENKLLGEKTPIEAVIIGPHPDRERRYDALALFLEARGLGNINIIQSEVPYLGG